MANVHMEELWASPEAKPSHGSEQSGPFARRSRQFQLFPIKQRRLAWSTYKVFVCALRFFYVKTLKRPFEPEDIPFPRKAQQLPLILSREEVAQSLQRLSI